MSAYDDLGGKPKAETYAEAMARHKAHMAELEEPEQLRAEREANKLEWVRRHDRVFSADFLSMSEERKISRALMKSLGYEVGDS